MYNFRPNGELYLRAMKNFGRLHDGIYHCACHIDFGGSGYFIQVFRNSASVDKNERYRRYYI